MLYSLLLFLFISTSVFLYTRLLITSFFPSCFISYTYLASLFIILPFRLAFHLFHSSSPFFFKSILHSSSISFSFIFQFPLIRSSLFSHHSSCFLPFLFFHPIHISFLSNPSLSLPSPLTLNPLPALPFPTSLSPFTHFPFLLIPYHYSPLPPLYPLTPLPSHPFSASEPSHPRRPLISSPSHCLPLSPSQGGRSRVQCSHHGHSLSRSSRKRKHLPDYALPPSLRQGVERSPSLSSSSPSSLSRYGI